MARENPCFGEKLYISLKICFIKYYIKPIKQNPWANSVAFRTYLTIDSDLWPTPKEGAEREILFDSCWPGRRLWISACRPARGRLESSPAFPHSAVDKLAEQSWTSCWAAKTVSQAVFSHCQGCIPSFFFKEVHPSALGPDENDGKIRRKCMKAGLLKWRRRWPFRMKVFHFSVALPRASLGCVGVAGNSLSGW